MKINLDVLSLQVNEFASLHDNIIATYIFGSAATGKMRPSSDIGIAVMSTRRIDGFAKVELETERSVLLHRDVDIQTS